jgi:phage-related baseplate assembly protein
MTEIDFSVLPPPQIVEELNYEAILQSMILDLRARDPSYTEILESDPGVKILEVCAARELILRQRINDALRATLIRFANAGDLDNLAAFYNVLRLEGETDEVFRLRTIERTKGSSSAGGAAWYRYHALSVSPHIRDAYVWRSAPGEVEVVVLSGEGEAAESAVGDALDQLGVAWGIIRDNGETDDAYRDRVLAEVAQGGGYGTASPALIAAVDAVVQADSVRPVTDTVTTVGAEILEIDVAASVWLYPETPDSVFNGLADRLRESFDAQSGLGWDLTQSWISAQLHPAGVQRVEVTSPTSGQVVTPRQAPVLGTVDLTMAGRDR